MHFNTFANLSSQDWFPILCDPDNMIFETINRSEKQREDRARRAERAFRHELGVKDSNYIQFG